MQFEQDKSIEQLGEKAGYIFSYFLFTTILFFILGFTHKIPESWSYLHVMGITVVIVTAGLGIKRMLR